MAVFVVLYWYLSYLLVIWHCNICNIYVKVAKICETDFLSLKVANSYFNAIKGINIHELPENTLSCNLFPISICFLTHSHLFIQKRRGMSTNEKAGSRFFPLNQVPPLWHLTERGERFKYVYYTLPGTQQASIPWTQPSSGCEKISSYASHLNWLRI